MGHPERCVSLIAFVKYLTYIALKVWSNGGDLSTCLASLGDVLINRRWRCLGNKMAGKVMEAAAPGVAALEALRVGVQAEAQRRLT